MFLRVNRFSLKQGRRMLTPMGYARQTDLPGKPFETRRYLVGFLGSIENRAHPRFSVKRLVGTPKHIARSRMVNPAKACRRSARQRLPRRNGRIQRKHYDRRR